MRILFVEDNLEFARTVTAQFLGEHAVTFAADVAEAKVQLAGDAFDVLLVDHDLPDGIGTEVIRHARSLGIDADVIAVSALDGNNEALEAAGARASCSKGSFEAIGAVLAAGPRRG